MLISLHQRSTVANSLFQSSEGFDRRENLLEMVQQNLCSRNQETNMTSRSFTDR